MVRRGKGKREVELNPASKAVKDATLLARLEERGVDLSKLYKLPFSLRLPLAKALIRKMDEEKIILKKVNPIVKHSNSKKGIKSKVIPKL